MNTKIFTHNETKDFADIYPLDLPAGVTLKVRVDDDRLRDKGVSYDGREDVFAIVPRSDGSWGRYDLTYTGAPEGIDVHEVMLKYSDPGISWDAAHQMGIAFGIDCHDQRAGDTTVWLQPYGQNYLRGYPFGE